MSHELRTPLNAIDGYAELLEMGLRGPVTDAQRSDLARIRRSQRHLLGLINDVLNFARVEAGHVELAIADVPLAEIVEGLEALVAPQVMERGLSLRLPARGPVARGARGRGEGAADPAEPAVQRGQVHGRGRARCG